MMAEVTLFALSISWIVSFMRRLASFLASVYSVPLGMFARGVIGVRLGQNEDS